MDHSAYGGDVVQGVFVGGGNGRVWRWGLLICIYMLLTRLQDGFSSGVCPILAGSDHEVYTGR